MNLARVLKENAKENTRHGERLSNWKAEIITCWGNS
jgi:hypothetical protein